MSARDDHPPRAILLDVLGTLVRLEPPAPRLRAELARRGVEVSERQAREAIRSEIAYYLSHHIQARDAASLAELRERCADVVRGSLARPDLDRPVALEALLAAIRFEPYPDAAPALRALRERGARLVAASNWDCSLPEVLERASIAPLLDGIVSSALVGEPKPNPAVFLRALELAGARREEALVVGDGMETDIAGARAAGIRAVLLVRGAEAPAPSGVPVVADLGELAPKLLPR